MQYGKNNIGYSVIRNKEQEGTEINRREGRRQRGLNLCFVPGGTQDMQS